MASWYWHKCALLPAFCLYRLLWFDSLDQNIIGYDRDRPIILNVICNYSHFKLQNLLFSGCLRIHNIIIQLREIFEMIVLVDIDTFLCIVTLLKHLGVLTTAKSLVL